MLLFAEQYGMPGGFSGLLSQIFLTGWYFLLVEGRLRWDKVLLKGEYVGLTPDMTNSNPLDNNV